MPMTNEERADYAAAAVDEYSRVKEGRPDSDEASTLASDLICDLLHLIRAHGDDPAQKLRCAVTNFVAEEGEDDEMNLDPDIGPFVCTAFPPNDAAAVDFVRMVARMNYDGEEIEGRTEAFEMTNDDTHDAMIGLIYAARALVAPADPATPAEKQERPYCLHCGSKHLGIEVTAYYDEKLGRIEVGDICGKGHYCEHCEGETRLEWRTPEDNATFKASGLCENPAPEPEE